MNFDDEHMEKIQEAGFQAILSVTELFSKATQQYLSDCMSLLPLEETTAAKAALITSGKNTVIAASKIINTIKDNLRKILIDTCYEIYQQTRKEN